MRTTRKHRSIPLRWKKAFERKRASPGISYAKSSSQFFSNSARCAGLRISCNSAFDISGVMSWYLKRLSWPNWRTRGGEPTAMWRSLAPMSTAAFRNPSILAIVSASRGCPMSNRANSGCSFAPRPYSFSKEPFGDACAHDSGDYLGEEVLCQCVRRAGWLPECAFMTALISAP